ncbi:acyltransferase family protein [Lysobacter sp. 2RAF19]
MAGERTLASAWASGHNHFNVLRLIAAWLVIYGHAWAITGTPGGDLLARATQVKFAGAIAVDMFFVISGFLIAASLQRNSVRGYLGSRALRILPALVACVLLSVFVLGPMMTTSHDYWSADTWRYLWSNATLWRAEFHLPGVFETLPQTAVNGSLWTLPVEARLYLLLLGASLVGLLTAKRYLLPWLALIAGIAAFAWFRSPLPDWLGNDLWCVAFFVTGTAAWLWRERIRLSWMPVVALLILAALLRGTPWFAAPYFALVAYGTLWLAFAPVPAKLAHHDLSYGLYLYGWPSAQIVQTYSPGPPMHNVLWASVLAFACAAASWFLVERPALQFKRRFGTRTPVESPARPTHA